MYSRDNANAVAGAELTFSTYVMSEPDFKPQNKSIADSSGMITAIESNQNAIGFIAINGLSYAALKDANIFSKVVPIQINGYGFADGYAQLQHQIAQGHYQFWDVVEAVTLNSLDPHSRQARANQAIVKEITSLTFQQKYFEKMNFYPFSPDVIGGDCRMSNTLCQETL